MHRYTAGTVEGERAGKPLANGWRCILFAFIGDLDYFGNVLKLHNWQTKTDFCNLCKATLVGQTSFTDNRLGSAPWLSTIWTAASWWEWEGSDGESNKQCLCSKYVCVV